MWLIKSNQTTKNETHLKTDGYYLILRHCIVELAAAGDIFIFIDYKTTAICQFTQIVFEI